MVVAIVLALVGTVAQIGGFWIAARAVHKAWRTAQVDERFWFPDKNRQIYVTDAVVAIDFALSAEVEVVLPDDATADQKINWIVGRLRDLERNTQVRGKNFADELVKQRSETEQRMNAIGAEIADAGATYLRDSVSELRVTARGLVLAIVGLLLQIPSILA